MIFLSYKLLHMLLEHLEWKQFYVQKSKVLTIIIVIDHNTVCEIYLSSLSFGFIENLEGAFNSCSVGGASFIPRVGEICLGVEFVHIRATRKNTLEFFSCKQHSCSHVREVGILLFLFNNLCMVFICSLRELSVSNQPSIFFSLRFSEQVHVVVYGC